MSGCFFPHRAAGLCPTPQNVSEQFACRRLGFEACDRLLTAAGIDGARRGGHSAWKNLPGLPMRRPRWRDERQTERQGRDLREDREQGMCSSRAAVGEMRSARQEIGRRTASLHCLPPGTDGNYPLRICTRRMAVWYNKLIVIVLTYVIWEDVMRRYAPRKQRRSKKPVLFLGIIVPVDYFTGSRLRVHRCGDPVICRVSATRIDLSPRRGCFDIKGRLIRTDRGRKPVAGGWNRFRCICSRRFWRRKIFAL